MDPYTDRQIQKAGNLLRFQEPDSHFQMPALCRNWKHVKVLDAANTLDANVFLVLRTIRPLGVFQPCIYMHIRNKWVFCSFSPKGSEIAHVVHPNKD